MTSANPTKTDITAVFKRLKSLAPNKQCFDCGAMNPTWASVTYGVFLCIDCSAVHRSLGVHITFIRSTQLDTNWTWLQLRAMQIGGNASAKSFFEQHNCTTSDAHIKYKSRAAQLYREKLHASAMKSLKQGQRVHLDSTHQEPGSPPVESGSSQHEFFEEHEKLFPSEVSAAPIPVSNGNTSNGNLSKSNLGNDDTNMQGPNIEAALSTSPKSAQELLANHKPTIGNRTGAKKGLGGTKKGGLGAQKVKTNFADIESAAIQKEKEQSIVSKPVKSDKEEQENFVSMNLVYKEQLTVDEGKRNEQLKNMDAKKKEQVERLGMGSTGTRLVSHSATSDMQCIAQENPANGNNPYKLDRFMSRGQKGDVDDFEIIDSMRSFQIKSNTGFFDAKGDDFDMLDKSSWSKKSSLTNLPPLEESSSSVVNRSDDDRSRSRKTCQVSDSSEAQQKFGNAKSISSDQYFGGSRDIDFEAKQNLRKFEGSSGISSADLFGGPSGHSGSSSSHYNYSSTGPDLAEIKEGVRQGITKVAGRLSNLASDVMGSIQRK